MSTMTSVAVSLRSLAYRSSYDKWTGLHLAWYVVIYLSHFAKIDTYIYLSLKVQWNKKRPRTAYVGGVGYSSFVVMIPKVLDDYNSINGIFAIIGHQMIRFIRLNWPQSRTTLHHKPGQNQVASRRAWLQFERCACMCINQSLCERRKITPKWSFRQCQNQAKAKSIAYHITFNVIQPEVRNKICTELAHNATLTSVWQKMFWTTAVHICLYIFK